MTGDWVEGLRFGADGLLPVVVQHAGTGEVLMLAYADREAVARTVAEGRAWFYSRSRRSLWRKGETSGNALEVREVRYDCDADALLYRALPAGPTCHTGEASCFHRTGWLAPSAGPATGAGSGGPTAGSAAPAAGGETRSDAPSSTCGPAAAGATPHVPGSAAVLDELYRVVLARKADPSPGSYTARLLSEGRDRILQKVGEEAVEVVLAGKGEDPDRLVSELADLLFHVTVLLGERELAWDEVFAELRRRRGRQPHPHP